MEDEVARSFLGTRGYLAPEMLQRNAYDKSVDIWVNISGKLASIYMKIKFYNFLVIF